MEESKGETEAHKTDGFALIEKLILDGEAPPHIKIAAAKGALPLNQFSLLHLKVFLKDDSDPSVHSEALRGIDAIGEDELLKLLKDRRCHPSVLAFFAEKKKEETRFLDAIVLNSSASDETLVTIAGTASTDTLGLLITNEQRLIACPALLDAVERNAALNDLQKAKIGELREKFVTGKIAVKPEIQPEGVISEETALPEIDITSILGDSYIIGGDEFEKGPQEVKSIYQKILMMNVPQKILHALRGGLVERQVLIRDSHRIVSLSVLENPRITEPEIEKISSSKSVDDEILRVIGRHRDWTKHYAVSLNLVKNPKTPPSISTALIHRLTNMDLKQMKVDKNVPELIRGMAKKVLDNRTQKTEKSQKK